MPAGWSTHTVSKCWREQLVQPLEEMVVAVVHLKAACQGLQEGVMLIMVDRNSNERHSDWT